MLNFKKYYLYSMLRTVKRDLIDFYKMQRYCGVVGKWLSALERSAFWRTQHVKLTQRKLSNPMVGASEANYSKANKIYSEKTRLLQNREDLPKITIITPVLNKVSVLDACMASVVNQNYPDFEYIVIDCGSTDGSVDIIKRYASKLSYWCSRAFDNKAQAINEGLNYAGGFIFNWLEPEDQLEPGALLGVAAAFLGNQHSAAWVGANRRIRPDNGSVVIHPNGMERENLILNWNEGQFSQSSCFLDTQKTRSIGGLAEMWSVLYGLDLWVRLLGKAKFSTGKGSWSRTRFPSASQIDSRTPMGSEWSILQEKQGITAPDEQSLVSQVYTIPPSLQTRLDELNHLNGAYAGFSRQRKIAIISYGLPRFDKSSSEFRLHRIVQILLDSNCRVDFYYGVNTVEDERYKQSFNGRISYHYLPYDPEGYVKSLSAANPDCIWISELWRIPFIAFAVQMTRDIKEKNPNLRIVADTVDFHYKEFYRKYEQSNQSDDLDLAKKYLDLENQLYQVADVVTVVSEDEKKDLQNHFDYSFQIEVVPNIHDLPVHSRPWSKRRNICFLGNFGTAHNADAVHYFLDHIFERILEFDANVEFHVLGFLAHRHRQDFKHPNVKVVGGLKNLQKALSSYRLFACPLTYGAGMKGKIGDAIIAGTPIVTTSIGAEGLPVKDGNELFIADSPDEFAEKCCQCISDPVTWHNFSMKAKLMIAENFSSKVVARQLQAILSSSGVG